MFLQGILVLESRARSSDLVEDVEVDTSKVAAVLPVRADLALQVKEGDLISSDRGDAGNRRTKEL